MCCLHVKLTVFWRLSSDPYEDVKNEYWLLLFNFPTVVYMEKCDVSCVLMLILYHVTFAYDLFDFSVNYLLLNIRNVPILEFCDWILRIKNDDKPPDDLLSVFFKQWKQKMHMKWYFVHQFTCQPSSIQGKRSC